MAKDSTLTIVAILTQRWGETVLIFLSIPLVIASIATNDWASQGFGPIFYYGLYKTCVASSTENCYNTDCSSGGSFCDNLIMAQRLFISTILIASVVTIVQFIFASDCTKDWRDGLDDRFGTRRVSVIVASISLLLDILLFGMSIGGWNNAHHAFQSITGTTVGNSDQMAIIAWVLLLIAVLFGLG